MKKKLLFVVTKIVKFWLSLYAVLNRQFIMKTIEVVAAIIRRGSHPEAEIDRVTTPGGITIRGLNAMEAAGFTAVVIAGVKG